MMNTNLFEQFSNLNVLIVGDVMIDRYLAGKVDRISPEAPVPVIELSQEDNRLGGAANVALNIKAMGATPYLFSVIGDDPNGTLLQELLPETGISARHLVRSAERQTTVKTRVIAQSQHILRVDREDRHNLSDSESEQLLDQIQETLETKDIHVILFQDYNKGVLTKPVIREIILEAIRRDIPTTVDPKYQNFWAYKHVSLFKPNLREVQQQLSTQNVQAQLSDLNQAAVEIQRRLGNPYTLITLSDKGLFIFEKEQGKIIPTHPRSIADVCGAGDTVISIAALGLALGLPMEQTAQLANLAGGQVCEKVGVVPVDKEQLQREYEDLVTTNTQF